MTMGEFFKTYDRKKAMEEEILKKRREFEAEGIDNKLVSDGDIEAMIMCHEYPDGWPHVFKKEFSDEIEENPPCRLGMCGIRSCV